jgi:hypothetical protein
MRAGWAALILVALQPSPLLGAERPGDDSEAAQDWAEVDAPEQPEVGSPRRFDLGLRIGYGRRLDDPALFPADDRNGLMLGAGVALFVVRRMAIGLTYEHLGLGTEKSGLLPTGSFEVDRDLHALWLDARLYPWLSDRFGVYLGIGAAPVWQGAEMTGSLWPRHDPGRWVSFRCEGSDSANLALRGELAADIGLGAGVRTIVAAGMDGYRLSDEVIDDCVPGAGSALVFGLRVAVVYGMDLW